MAYADGYVLAVPRKHLAFYKKMATLGARTWMKHGALEYKECVGEDLAANGQIPFGKMMKIKRSETVVFSWVVFKSRKHRDKVNAAVYEEMGAMKWDPKDMAIMKKLRIVYGGFEVLVSR